MANVDVTIHGVFFKGPSLLLAKTRDKTKGWTLPGGHIEPGQSAKRALKVELREETGGDWKVEERRLCGVYIRLGRNGLPAGVHFIVTGLHSGGEPVARKE